MVSSHDGAENEPFTHADLEEIMIQDPVLDQDEELLVSAVHLLFLVN